MKVRTHRVMVRLATGKGASPDEVAFSTEEKRAVAKVAKACGYSYLSTFIRELGVRAAGGKPGDDPYRVVKTAALKCNLPLGEWLRLVSLAAAEFTPLESHLVTARSLVRNTLQPLVD